MNPQLALLLCTGLVVALAFREARRPTRCSAGLWIPLVWVLICGSRPLAMWLNAGPPMEMPDDYLAGNPIDRAVQTVLIVAGLIVLSHRKVEWSAFRRRHVLIIAYFAYAGLSVCWSDYEMVALKRWLKSLGDVVMAAIVVTDPAPIRALSALVRRAAFVLLPFSILLIKYYPNLGRFYSPGGGQVLAGVTMHKNQLGYECMIVGLCLSWELLMRRRARNRASDVSSPAVALMLLAMVFYLLFKTNSVTSWVCYGFGLVTMLLAGIPVIRRNVRFTAGTAIVVLGVMVLAGTLPNLMGTMITAVGRDPTLTGRTDLWAELLGMGTSPLFGVGFESFWLGPRAQHFWDAYWWHPNQAHNGYLELYLNLGLIGLGLAVSMLMSSFADAFNHLSRSIEVSRLRLGFLVVLPVYNCSEAAFKGLHLLWLMFLVVAMLDRWGPDEGTPAADANDGPHGHETGPVVPGGVVC